MRRAKHSFAGIAPSVQGVLPGTSGERCCGGYGAATEALHSDEG